MIFSDIFDDIEQHMLTHGKTKRLRQSNIRASEVITVLLWFHLTGIRIFKTFCLCWAKPFISSYFPNLPSYSRFIELKKQRGLGS